MDHIAHGLGYIRDRYGDTSDQGPVRYNEGGIIHPASEGARIVLVKPGDVLILGNVGALDEDDIATLTEALDKLKRSLGLDQILVFEADIDLAAQVGRADSSRDTMNG